MRIALPTFISGKTIPWPRVLVMAAILAVPLVGVISYTSQQEIVRKNALEQVSMVADLKVDQVQSMLDSQKAVSLALTHGTLLAASVEQWIQTGQISAGVRNRLLTRLQIARKDYHFYAVSILKMDGTKLLSTEESGIPLSPPDRDAVAEIQRNQASALTSIYQELELPGKPDVLDILSPVLVVDAKGSHAVAILLIRLDPRQTIFPLLYRWPISSTTAETLLVERRGESVVFLNPLRSHKGVEQQYSVPIDARKELAVQAALGEKGLLDGLDYRNIAVLGTARAIPGTHWVVIAKEDKAELYHSLLVHALSISLLPVAFLLFLLFGIHSWMQQRNAALIQQSGIRFKALFESMADAVFVIGPDHRFIEANQLALDRLGYTREELFRLGPAEINPPQAKRGVDANFARLMREGAATFETRHMRKDGSSFPVEIRSRQIDIDGKTLILSIARDISDRIAAATAVEQSRFMLQTVLDNLPLGVFWKDKDLRYLGCNKTFARDSGIEDRASIIGKNDFEVHPTSAVSFRAHDIQVLESGAGKFGIEETVERIDGHTAVLRTHLVPLHREGGESQGLLGIYEDITAQKAAAAEIQASQARIRAVFDNAGVGIGISDTEGNYLEVNAKLADLLGYSGEELLRLNNQMTCYPEDLVLTRGSEAAFRRGEAEPILIEKRFIRKNGDVVWGLVSYTPIRDEQGKFQSIAGIVVDITERKRIDAEFALISERLSIATQGARIGIWDWDLVNDRLVWDDQMCRLYGVRREDFGNAYDAWLRSLYPEDAEKNSLLVEAALRGEAEYDPEFRIRWPDGSEHYIKAAAKILRDKSGKPVRMVGINFDITARKNAEQALQKSMERLQIILSNLYTGVLVLNENSTVELINPCMCELFDISQKPEELIGMTAEQLLELINPMTVDVAQNNQRISELIALKEPVCDEEHRLKNGRILLRDFIPLMKDGKMVGRIWTHRDITSIRQAEEKIAESEKFLKKVTDALPGLVGYWTRDLRCVFANAKYKEWFGRDPAEMIGIRMQDFLGETRFREQQASIEKVLVGETQVFKRPIIRPDGLKGTLWIYAIPDFIEGEVSGFLIVATDITQLETVQVELVKLNQQLEDRTLQAEAASRAKSDFLANMSHEIRTPMNAIMGLSYLALKTELTPKQQNYLNRIQIASRNLLSLINDILDLSKIEAEKMEIEHIPFNLQQVVEHVTGILAEKAQEKGLEVRVDLPPEIPLELVGDSLRLGQILLNLISNAVKFTEHGNVSLSLEVLSQNPEKISLRFKIQDTGIGISEEVLPRLFHPFSQADASTTRKFGGSGLGLTICKRLIDLLGGEISVHSTLGEGSTFAFTLPFELQNPAFTVTRKSAIPHELRESKVLVVDDDPAVLKTLEKLLESIGLAAETRLSGREAIKELIRAQRKGDPYALMVLDWRMAEMDGIELARRVRNDGRIPLKPALILLTGHGGEEVHHLVDDLHLDGILLKPVSASLLQDTIAQILSSRRAIGAKVPGAYLRDQDAQKITGRILLAEDNATNRMVAVEMLEEAGFQVETALNGREAVEKALAPEAAFDLILMDVQMPEMDGLMATSRIREKLKDVPILAMTAQAMESERQRCLAAGMNDHISKPFDPIDLMQRVTHWLSTSRALAISASESVPGEINQLDIEALKSRFKGDTGKVAMLMEAMKRDLTSFQAALQQAILTQDSALAGRIAHSILGMNGFVLDPSFNQTATNLNLAMRSGLNWMDDAISLKQIVTAILKTLPANEDRPIPETSPVNNEQDLHMLFLELHRQLLRQSLSARKTLEALRGRIATDPTLHSLDIAIRSLDFEGALQPLSELAKAHGVDLTSME